MLASLLLGIFLCVPVGSMLLSQKLPADAQAVLTQYEADYSNVEACRLAERTADMADLLSRLTEVEKSFTRRREFNNAVLVRNFAKSLTEHNTVERQLEALRKLALGPLPEECKESVMTLIERDTGLSNACTSQQLTFARRAIEKLEEFLQIYAQQENLDACLEIEAAIKTLQKSAPAVDDGGLMLPQIENLTDAQIIKERRKVEQSFSTRLRETLDSLTAELAAIPRTQPILSELKKERDAKKQLAYLSSIVDSKSGKTKIAIEKGLRKAQALTVEQTTVLQAFDKRRRTEKDKVLRAMIAELDIDGAFRMYSEVVSDADNQAKISLRPQIPGELPNMPVAAASVFASIELEFLREIEQRFQSLAAQEKNTFRLRLQRFVNELDSSKREDRKAGEMCLQYLDSPAAAEICVLRLFPLYHNLPASVEAIEFLRRVDVLLTDRYRERMSVSRLLQDRLQPSIAQLLSMNAISECISVFVHIRWLQNRFDPVPVLSAEVPWTSQSSEAWVLDVAGNVNLTRFNGQNFSNWHPRQLIRVDGEPETQLKSATGIGEDWRSYDRYAPGPKPQRLTLLKPGQRVFGLRSKHWELATITDISTSAVTLEWEEDKVKKGTRMNWQEVRVVEP
jgi:hypothetical protein